MPYESTFSDCQAFSIPSILPVFDEKRVFQQPTPSMRRPVGVKGFFVFRWTRFSLSRRVAAVATLPSALFIERFSLGASWVFSFQPVLPPVCRPLVHL
jgi:hypothetical protein